MVVERGELRAHRVDLEMREAEVPEGLTGPHPVVRTREARDGWFSYDVKVTPDRPAAIVATYRGGEGRRRSFDVFVDGTKLAAESLEYHPTEALDREYALPIDLIRGKDRVTVKFQAQPQATAGALIELRTVAR